MRPPRTPARLQIDRHHARPRVAGTLQRSNRSADTSGVLNKRSAILLSAAIGLALELGIHAMSGRREAWDSGEYWTVGLPVALVLSLVIGLLTRDRDWLWTALVVPSQVLTMTVRNGALGGLWPLTVLLSTILSFPFVLAAFVGTRFRSRLQRPR